MRFLWVRGIGIPLPMKIEKHSDKKKARKHKILRKNIENKIEHREINWKQQSENGKCK